MANETERQRWDGAIGEHWVAEAERYDTMLGPVLGPLLAAAGAQSGEHILDVGCGNGALLLALAERVQPGGVVMGVDVSTDMLALAKERAERAGATNVRFVQADAQSHRLPANHFDAVVSRFGVMFFDDPVAAFANLGAALKPDGRVAFACWRATSENEWMTVPLAAALEHVPMPAGGDPNAPGPFAFADAGRVRSILTDAGFTDVALEPSDVMLPRGSSVDDAVDFMARTDFWRTFLKDVDDATASRVWQSVSAAIADHTDSDGRVVLGGAIWIVTARR